MGLEFTCDIRGIESDIGMKFLLRWEIDGDERRGEKKEKGGRNELVVEAGG